MACPCGFQHSLALKDGNGHWLFHKDVLPRFEKIRRNFTLLRVTSRESDRVDFKIVCQLEVA
jgi:hypothetical protein